MGNIPEFSRTVLPDRSVGSAGVAAARAQSDIKADNMRYNRQKGEQVSNTIMDYKIADAKAKNVTWVNENTINAKMDIAIKTDELRQARMGNPDNFEKDFDKEMEKVGESYLKTAPSKAARQAMALDLKELRGRQYVENVDWVRNRKVEMYGESVERSAQNLAIMAYRDGQAGKTIDDLQGYMNDVETSVIAGSTFVAPEKLDNMKRTMQKGVLSNYLEGLAGKNPEQAKAILNSKKYDDILGAEGIQNMDAIIKKKAKEAKETDEVTQIQNQGILMDTIADSSLTYDERLLQINKADLMGTIKNDFAADARRYVTSLKDIDAVTNSDTMANIITQMYDVNSVAEDDEKAYLTGVKNIRKEIMDKRASGELSSDDEKKLQNQMKTIMSAKTADATNAVSQSFGEANEIINQALPPERRGEAVRRLFYQTQNLDLEDMPQQERSKVYKAHARYIADQANLQSRQKVLKTVAELKAAPPAGQDTESVLKAKGYTMDDLKETAVKYGISEDDVIAKLRGK